MKITEELNSDEEEIFFDCKSGTEAQTEESGELSRQEAAAIDEMIERCVSASEEQPVPSSSETSEPGTDGRTKSALSKIDEVHLKELEALMTQDEIQLHRERALELKQSGNGMFGQGSFEEAAAEYTKAIYECPPSFLEDKAILYGNRAACHMKMESFDEAISDCCGALEFDERYTKALLRRAWCYEKREEHWDMALEDYNKILILNPSDKHASTALQRLPPLIAERNEKTKAEMMDKLKDLGNLVLRPFGLTTDNFKLEPNEQGGYSVQMQR